MNVLFFDRKPTAELDAILASILDKAFKGEFCRPFASAE
jgi:hypothetical protein